MIETWRWFGPEGKVTRADLRQTGASGIVTALYDNEPGMVWPRADIAARKARIEKAGPVRSRSKPSPSGNG